MSYPEDAGASFTRGLPRARGSVGRHRIVVRRGADAGPVPMADGPPITCPVMISRWPRYRTRSRPTPS